MDTYTENFLHRAQPGEYVEALVAQGRIEDARQTQTAQFIEGWLRATLYNTDVQSFEPAARQAGYEAGIAWMFDADLADEAHYHRITAESQDPVSVGVYTELADFYDR